MRHETTDRRARGPAPDPSPRTSLAGEEVKEDDADGTGSTHNGNLVPDPFAKDEDEDQGEDSKAPPSHGGNPSPEEHPIDTPANNLIGISIATSHTASRKNKILHHATEEYEQHMLLLQTNE